MEVARVRSSGMVQDRERAMTSRVTATERAVTPARAVSARAADPPDRRLRAGAWRAAGALALAVGLTATVAVPARAALPPELAQDLVGYYPFDETAGTT